MLVMLDNLRAVRESTDVATSDAVVRQAARRLQKTLGSDVHPARFADGIFAAVIEGADKSTLLAGANAVRTAIEGNAYRYSGHSLQLTACIGIGIGGGGEQSFLTLIQHADLACSLAREAGADRVHIHEPVAEAGSGLTPKRDLLDEIREAVEQEQMNLLFQPIVCLRGDEEERYEVLLRMRNADGRELLPETVFGVTQHHELGLALDRWVIAECIRILGERTDRTSTTTFFVNLLPATLEDDSVVDWLQEALAREQVDGGRIVFEVAEADARVHLEPLKRFMQRVTALGCRLSLERFGRGVDSIRLLSGLTAGYAKLDAAFVQDLVGSATKQQQLKELVQALEGVGTVPILGGVENLNTLPVLWSCGINFVQGFFLQRPHEKMSYDFAGGAF
jgi:diguanylate cyclase (GGDEF)-like protein